MNDMKVTAGRGDFYASVTIAMSGNRHFVQFIRRDEAHAFALELRAAADKIDPDVKQPPSEDRV